MGRDARINGDYAQLNVSERCQPSIRDTSYHHLHDPSATSILKGEAEMPPSIDSFYLTNGRDNPPLVHTFLNSATQTWQYVVADPATLHCVIIDPILEQNPGTAASAIGAVDELLSTVELNLYKVDHILETHSCSKATRSAAWALRMRLLESQGYAPQVYTGEMVSELSRLFTRKYGADSGFSTTLEDEPSDGQRLVVGRTKIVVLHVPGPSTPNRRAYLVGTYLFGAYAIAQPPGETLPTKGKDDGMTDDDRMQLWWSMRKVLFLPEDVRVYFEDGPAHPHGPYTTIEECRIRNEYVDLPNEKEFIIRRRGELRTLIDASQPPAYTKKRRPLYQRIIGIP